MNVCLNCDKKPARKIYKYCSNKCQKQKEYKEFIKRWREESEKGNNIVTTKNISRHVRNFLIERYNHSCSLCGWNKKHPVTGVIPLEVDHIDGNASNNLESNLRILCPNCHALTPSFRNLNKGKGRIGRNKKVVTKLTRSNP